jgi:hypothetical protein
MGHPKITRDQREMAVVLLANALRKDAHLRARVHQFWEEVTPLHSGMMKRRAEPSQRYVEGMRDLLGVLFANGHAVAEECLEEAYARAIGASAHVTNSGNGTRFTNM